MADAREEGLQHFPQPVSLSAIACPHRTATPSPSSRKGIDRDRDPGCLTLRREGESLAGRVAECATLSSLSALTSHDMIEPDISIYVGSELRLVEALESLERSHNHLGRQIAAMYSAIDRILTELEIERFRANSANT